MAAGQAVIKNYVASLTAVRSLTVRVISGARHGLAGDESRRAYSKLLATWLTEMVIGAREAPASPVVGRWESVAKCEACPIEEPIPIEQPILTRRGW